MSSMPAEIRERLLSSFTAREAALLIAEWRRDGCYPGYLHPGDPLGTVLAWLWLDDSDRALLMLDEFLEMLRAAEDVTPVTVDVERLLDGLRSALPAPFLSDHYDALAARARAELPMASHL